MTVSTFLHTHCLNQHDFKLEPRDVVLLSVIMKCFSQKPCFCLAILTLLAGAGAASLILSIMAAVLRCHRGTEAALTPRCPADRQQCPDPPDCWHWTLVPQLRQLYLHSSHIQDRKCSIAAPILSVSSLARSGGYITLASTKIQLNVNHFLSAVHLNFRFGHLANNLAAHEHRKLLYCWKKE